MNKMKENKKMYLTPKVSVVAFRIEGGYALSGNGNTAAQVSNFTTIEPNGRNNAYSLRGGEGDGWVPFQ